DDDMRAFFAKYHVQYDERYVWDYGCDYVSSLQPSFVLLILYLGLRPRLVCRRAFGPQMRNGNKSPSVMTNKKDNDSNEGGYSEARCGSSISMSSKHAPQTIAESATLKSGQW